MKSFVRYYRQRRGKRIQTRDVQPERIRKGATVRVAVIPVVRLQRNEEVWKIVVPPETPHHTDSFRDAVNGFLIGERPLPAHSKHRWPSADLKMMNAKVSRREKS